jgi:parallel beta-helix repeat protein
MRRMSKWSWVWLLLIGCAPDGPVSDGADAVDGRSTDVDTWHSDGDARALIELGQPDVTGTQNDFETVESDVHLGSDALKFDASDGKATDAASVATSCGPVPASLLAPWPAVTPPSVSTWQSGKYLCPGSVAPYVWANGANLPFPVTCTTSCAVLPHAETSACLGGQCLATRCESGWQDRNGFGNDGCEMSEPVNCDIYVSSTATTAGDGTAEHPFACLQPALDLAKPGCVVHVSKGDWLGPFVVQAPGVVVRGEGPEATRLLGATQATANKTPWPDPKLSPDSASPTVRATSADVVFEALGISGGKGAALVGGDGVVLRDVRINGVDAWIADPYGNMLETVGVRLGNGARLVGVSVSNIGSLVSSIGIVPLTTGIVTGPSARLFAVKVAAIQGGGSCYGNCYGAPWNPPQCGPRNGGAATGIAAGAGSIASGCEVTGIVGGKGGTPVGYAQTDAQCDPHAQLPDGAAIGYIARTDPTDTIDGQPVVDLVDCPGGEVSGYVLSGAASRLLVTGSPGATVSGNTISGSTSVALLVTNSGGVKLSGNNVQAQAETGLQIVSSPGADVAGNVVKGVSNAGPATGMSVANCGSCVLKGNVIQNVIAAVGNAIGLKVTDSPEIQLIDTTIMGVVGASTEGAGSSWEAPAGTATGLQEVGSPACWIDRLSVRAISGGTFKAVGGNPPITTKGGTATGVSLQTAGTVTHVSIAQLVGGGGYQPWPPPSGTYTPAGTVGLAATATLTVDHMSIDGANTPLLLTGATAISHTILSNGNPVSGYGPACIPSSVSFAWSNLWNVSMCLKGDGGAGMISLDPQFVDASNGDLHLLSTSPCIDAGAPTAAFCSEPAPNGCRVDLGAYGGTSAATSAASGKTCACP